MSVELLLVLILFGIFVLGGIRDINIGFVAIIAALFAGTQLLDMDVKGVLQGFPAPVFIMMLGILIILAIADLNGTAKWLVAKLILISGGRLAVLPWVLFATGLLSASLGPMALPVLFVIGIGLASKTGLHPLMFGAMALHGNQAGGFSPIGIYGVLFSGLSETMPVGHDPLGTYLVVVIINFLVAAATFFIFGGKTLFGQKASPEVLAELSQEGGRLNVEKAITVLALIAMLLGVILLKINVGVVAMLMAFIVLMFSSIEVRQKTFTVLPWSVLLIVAGILMYVHVMTEGGAIAWLAETTGAMSSPLFVALILCLLAAFVTGVSSTFGTFSVLIPVSIPFIAQGDLNATLLLACIAASAAVTDISPTSPWGALFIGSAEGYDRAKLTNTGLIYAGSVAVIVPLLTWLVLIVPGW